MARSVKGRGRPAGASSAVTPEAQARLPELLALPPEADLLAAVEAAASATPGGVAALIEALGASRDAAAGRVLGALAVGAADKDARKAARRALHRLRSAGIAVAVPVPAEPGPAPAREPEGSQPLRALVSAADGVGSRLLWLAYERPGGGLLTFNLVLNDIVGVKDMLVEETTRRRFERRLDEWVERTGNTTTDIPFEYALSLVAEGLALNAESGFPVPRELVIHRAQLGELPPPPTSALIHQHVSRGQAFLMPSLVEESVRLLDEQPEMAGWLFSYGEVERFMREYRQAEESRLILTSEPPEVRRERVLDSAMDALFTPAVRRGLRRRLEETAYIFWQSGRERAARQAVAAAFAIPDSGSVRAHPLLREMTLRSIILAAEVARSGMPPPPGANRTAWDPV